MTKEGNSVKKEDVTEEEYYGMTSKQISFCKEYLKSGNATEAYMTVYNTKASKNSISGQASKLLANPKIQSYIRDKQHMAYEQARAEDKDVMGVVDVLEWLTSVIKSNSRAIKMADRLNTKFVIIIGEEEKNSNIITIKNNNTKEEYKVSLEELIDFLDEYIS